MLSRSRAIRLAIPLVCLAAALVSRPSHAQWPNNPNVNVPLCAASGEQTFPATVSDGCGGAIVAWQDGRTAVTGLDIYVRLVSVAGNPQWTADGVAVCTAVGDQQYAKVATDGAGGAFITWQDGRTAVNAVDIYAAHVLSTGALDPAWPVNGLPICALPANQLAPEIIADGSGGAIIAWYDERGNVDTRPDLYAQRVSATGAIQWAANGVPVTTAQDIQQYQQMISDGAGGAILAWMDKRTGDWNIAAQRMNGANGAQLWLPNGVAVCTAAADQFDPHLAPDGSGGAIVTWSDARSGNALTDIYAQRVSAAGAMLWAPNGVPVCTAANQQTGPIIVSDGLGGGIIAWTDYRNGPGYDTYAQRIDPSGTSLWAANGVALTTATSFQGAGDIISDGQNGAIVAWQDYRTQTYFDIYARRVNSAGVPLWTADGAAISTAPDHQFRPVMATDGAGGAILAWEESRNTATSGTDIYVQQISASGALGAPGAPPCSPTPPPGIPLGGGGLAARFREDFVCPPSHPGEREQAVTVTLPLQVQSGFLVVVDDSTSAAPDVQDWSDVIWFRPFDPQFGPRALFVSGPPERPLTDADLGPYGLSLAQIQTGNTRYLRERLPFTTYVATDPWTQISASYNVYSDVDTLPPGAPLDPLPAGVTVVITEPADETGEYKTVQLPARVQPCFVVLLNDTTGNHEDATKWSDVLCFTPSATGPAQATLVSDRPPPAGTEGGIRDSDLAPLGITIRDVIEGNTMYVPESEPTIYPATNPATGTITYEIHGDVGIVGVQPGGSAARFAIRSVAPNPARGPVRIEFEMPRAGRARLEVFDLAGARARTLFDGEAEAGVRTVSWDGRDGSGAPVSAGVYFARLSGGGKVLSRRLLLLR